MCRHSQRKSAFVAKPIKELRMKALFEGLKNSGTPLMPNANLCKKERFN
jgi:hypothetical protein